MVDVETLVLLHGFAGTSRAWDGVLAHLPAERYRPLPLDLPGHASQSGAAGAVDLERTIESVLRRCAQNFALCGYSLGGRIALRAALAAPERVASLTLIASGPGIEDAGERARRRAADRALADEIERASIERFIERWCAQPMFVSDPAEVRALARADYRRNAPRPLAAVLRGLGQGELAPVWERLGELAMPVTVVAGERDANYQAIAQRMAALIPHARIAIVPGGHRLPLESPRAVAAAIEAGVADG
jgi:2-succinyl-6-hydroxy-2,4-cyclohexadiene-1-carboxylate synthase